LATTRDARRRHGARAVRDDGTDVAPRALRPTKRPFCLTRSTSAPNATTGIFNDDAARRAETRHTRERISSARASSPPLRLPSLHLPRRRHVRRDRERDRAHAVGVRPDHRRGVVSRKRRRAANIRWVRLR
jgi:hypothetical protein